MNVAGLRPPVATRSSELVHAESLAPYRLCQSAPELEHVHSKQ